MFPACEFVMIWSKTSCGSDSSTNASHGSTDGCATNLSGANKLVDGSPGALPGNATFSFFAGAIWRLEELPSLFLSGGTLLLLGCKWELDDGFGRGTVLLESADEVDDFWPRAKKRSGGCWVILLFGPLEPGSGLFLSIFSKSTLLLAFTTSQSQLTNLQTKWKHNLQNRCMRFNVNLTVIGEGEHWGTKFTSEINDNKSDY